MKRHLLLLAAVKPVAEFLARLEEGRKFLVDRHRLARARITANARRTMLHGKRAEAAQLDALAFDQSARNLIEHDGDEFLDIAMKKVRVFICKFLHKFRLDHVFARPFDVQGILFAKGPRNSTRARPPAANRRKPPEFRGLTLSNQSCGVKALLAGPIRG